MVSKWEIWLADLEPAFGSEQGKTRPVLIISNEEVNKFLNIVNAIPITTRKENREIYPNEILIQSGNYGLKKDSLIITYQIRTLDKKRLLRKLGQITEFQKQQEVFEALKFQFEIK